VPAKLGALLLGECGLDVECLELADRAPDRDSEWPRSKLEPYAAHLTGYRVRHGDKIVVLALDGSAADRTTGALGKVSRCRGDVIRPRARRPIRRLREKIQIGRASCRERV